MKPLRFWKVQSIGNHFPLIHLADVPGKALPDLAKRLCSERVGVGGDGLLAVGMEGHAIRLRMFNPDGTEDFCGNGLRCAAMHGVAQGWVGERFDLLHLDRKVPATVGEDGLIATEIGKADYTPSKIPMQGAEKFDTTIWSGMDEGVPLSLFGSVLTTGSAHTVIPTMILPDDAIFRAISAKIETDSRFPQRTSVIWRTEEAPNVLRIRIWERGVGETLGCGTGSSAAAADYLRRKGTGGRVEVRNPGGTVWVSAPAWDAPLVLTGRAETLFEGTVKIG